MQHVTDLSHFLLTLDSEVWLSGSAPFVPPKRRAASFIRAVLWLPDIHDGSVAVPPRPTSAVLQVIAKRSIGCNSAVPLRGTRRGREDVVKKHRKA